MDDMILVDGVKVKAPSTFKWKKQDVSGSNATRNQVAYMYKNKIAEKRALSLGWWCPSKEETTKILQAFNPEYVMVTYYDPLIGGDVEKEFYTGDMEADVSTWTVFNKRYSQCSFDVIER